MTKAKLNQQKLALDHKERQLEKDIAAGKFSAPVVRVLRRALKLIRRILRLEYVKNEMAEGPKLALSTLERRAARAMAFRRAS